MWDEVRRLRDEGMTVFLTTHYLDEADALCDRVAIIDHGAIVASDTPAELKREVAGDVVTLGLGARRRGRVAAELDASRYCASSRRTDAACGCTWTTAPSRSRRSCGRRRRRRAARLDRAAPPEPRRRVPRHAPAVPCAMEQKS
jgi:ABC-type multidrug transport system ATPase subunit